MGQQDLQVTVVIDLVGMLEPTLVVEVGVEVKMTPTTARVVLV
jgi:hypothetical protein